MGQIDAALAHHRHQIAIAQFETEIPANAQDHDLPVEVPTFKESLRSARIQASVYHLRASLAVCTRAPKFTSTCEFRLSHRIPNHPFAGLPAGSPQRIVIFPLTLLLIVNMVVV
jgi:hypothetical protein